LSVVSSGASTPQEAWNKCSILKVRGRFLALRRRVGGSVGRDVKASRPCGLEAKLFGLDLVVSGLGLIEVGLVASKFEL